MTTEEKWTAGNQFAEILLLRRSTSLSSSEEAVREPERKGERTMRRRRDGGGRVRHEQDEQGKCKICGVNGTRSKEKLGEKVKEPLKSLGQNFASLLSVLLISNTKGSSLTPPVWIQFPPFQAHPNRSISHQPVSKDIREESGLSVNTQRLA